MEVEKSALSTLYIAISMTSHSFMIAAVLFFIFLIPSLIVKNTKISSMMSAIPALCILGFFVLDSKIYGMYRMHINYAILKLYANIGEFQTMEIPPILTVFFILFCLCLFFMLFYSRLLIHSFVTKKNLSIHWSIYLITFVICALSISADKALSIYGYKYHRPQITKYDSLLPFYMVALSGFEKDNAQTIATDQVGSKILDYPKHPFDLQLMHKYNIVWIVLESWNVHYFDQDIMPFTYQFGQKSSVFVNNISAGNSTRFGIFGLFFALPGNYWFDFLKSRSNPFFLQVLQQNNYNMLLQMSASIKSPEFETTIFSHIDSSMLKDIGTLKGGSNYERDQSQVDNVHDFIDSSGEKPFFAFMFFDSSHSGYSFPKELEKYQDYSKYVYLDADDKAKREKIINRYKNSLYYEDTLIQKVVEHLQAKNLMERTIVVITGDHGEEMYETGHYGHNNQFNLEQAGAPLIVYVPHQAPKVYDNLTSTIDVVPTLLQVMGNTTNIQHYSLGRHLFTEHAPRRYVLTCNHNLCATYTDQVIFEFGYNMYALNRFKAYHHNYTLFDTNDELYKIQLSSLHASLKDMSSFLK